MRNINSTAEVPSDGTALLVIGTDWCQYCGKTYRGIKEVMPSHPDVELLKIDGDDEPDALTSVGAKTYPQMLLYKDGQLIAQRESADAEQLREWLGANGLA